MEIAEFLLARIAEDEAAARSGQTARLPFWVGQVMGRSGSRSAPDYVNHFNPARLLAECEAKRRLVTEVVEEIDGLTNAWADATDALPFSVDYPSQTLLRLLALPYADHHDYQPEWNPLARA